MGNIEGGIVRKTKKSKEYIIGNGMQITGAKEIRR